MPENFKAILPKNLKGIEKQLLDNAILTRIRSIGGRQTMDFYKPVKTWVGDKPEFKYKATKDADVYKLLVTTKDEDSAGTNKYRWLNFGTKVRRALMSRDFKAKTTPGFLGSGRGRGKMLFVSKKLERPGIKPRKWEHMIYKKWIKPWFTEIQDAVKNFVAASGHAVK
jgi:hypothetical protein